MKFLRILGWIFVPYIMVFVRWKKIGGVAKTFGTIWAVLALLMAIGSFLPDEPLTAEELAAEEARQAVQAEKLKKIEGDDKTKLAAIEKEKADNEAKIKELEAKAKEPISIDYATFDDPYDKMTDVQKDKFWEEVKGKYVQWTGKVVEVTEKNIQVKVDADTFISDFLATIVKEQREDLANINLDDTITIYGKLTSKEGVILPWSLSEAEIK